MKPLLNFLKEIVVGFIFSDLFRILHHKPINPSISPLIFRHSISNWETLRVFGATLTSDGGGVGFPSTHPTVEDLLQDFLRNAT